MYYKLTKDGYIAVIGTGEGGTPITEEEYEDILSILQNRLAAEDGYAYRLKEDLTWELVEVPIVEPTDDEISGIELLSMIEEVL